MQQTYKEPRSNSTYIDIFSEVKERVSITDVFTTYGGVIKRQSGELFALCRSIMKNHISRR